MTERQSSYRQIMKATSLFGGVQVFNIAIAIIRSKFIAVLLGPAGMGIMGLLTSTIGLIGSVTNFGLSISAVKDIATANSTGDNKQISLISTVLKRLVWITGILGMAVTIILSPWLSRLTFGNSDYTLAFIWISIALLFTQLSNGQLVILQGLRKLQLLAKANIFGSALGLLVTLPLYYFWGIDGIVPGIIGAALITLIATCLYSSTIVIESINIPFSQTYSEGKNMLRMGFLISLSGLLSISASYFVRIFINRTGGVEQVGLYTAGFAIINTYVGLIFNAMGTDYYPRLSAVALNNKLCKQSINQQTEIAILILAPILIIFLIFINWIVILLYSDQFVAVNGMIYWAALGMFFKAVTWAIGYILLAKSASKIFLLSELIANVYLMIFNILGYKYFGLEGLGFSFLISYIFSLVQVFFIAKIKYQFSFDRALIKIFTIQFGIAILCFIAVMYFNKPYHYVVGSVLILISIWYSIMELNKRLGLLILYKNYINKTQL